MKTYFIKLTTFFDVAFFENGDLRTLMREMLQSIASDDEIDLEEYAILPSEVVMLWRLSKNAETEELIKTISVESSAVIKQALHQMQGLITFEKVGTGFSRAHNTSIWSDDVYVQEVIGEEERQIKSAYIRAKRV